MKVIGAGLPRTATSTTFTVLEQLGFGPCYHMRNLMADWDGQLPLWERLVAGQGGLEEIVGGFASCCDFPTSRYYKELADLYPDAKVLLSVRSREGWVRSMRETIWPMYYGDSVLRHVNAARGQLDDHWRRFTDLMIHMTWSDEHGALPGAQTADDAQLGALMDAWEASVKAAIPPERLLVWNPADGYVPLCEFLEVDVPDGPVPQINDTSAFIEGILGGGMKVLNEWWDARERPDSGLHGTPV